LGDFVLIKKKKIRPSTFFFFCGTGAWTQDLHLELLHQPYFCEDEIGSSGTICLRWLRTSILLTSATWAARIIGMSHWCLAGPSTLLWSSSSGGYTHTLSAKTKYRNLRVGGMALVAERLPSKNIGIWEGAVNSSVRWWSEISNWDIWRNFLEKWNVVMENTGIGVLIGCWSACLPPGPHME
jgi:hypothetical protein